MTAIEAVAVCLSGGFFDNVFLTVIIGSSDDSLTVTAYISDKFQRHFQWYDMQISFIAFSIIMFHILLYTKTQTQLKVSNNIKLKLEPILRK